MKALVNWILKEKLGFVEKACEKPNIHIGFSRELLLEKLVYWMIDSMTFKYRRKITITEQSGNDLTDYQVLIELNSTNFDFSHAQANGEDIRFTDANGNLLPYWIEEWDAVNESAKVWVKVPSIPANGSTEIWMYYGNPRLKSASDGEATFEFFDGFSAYTLSVYGYSEDNVPTAVPWHGAVYDPVSNKTFFVFMSSDGKHFVYYYDHETGEISGLYDPGVTPTADLTHGAPTIALDNDGYIWVFGGSHDTGARVAISKNPRDPTEWEEKTRIGPETGNVGGITYPQPITISDGMLVIGRHRDSDTWYDQSIAMWKSTDRGETWTKTIIAKPYSAKNYPFLFRKINGKIYGLVSPRNVDGDDYWHGAMFMMSDDEGQTWKKADGTVYTLPVDADQADWITTNLHWKGTNVDVLPNGNPVAVLIEDSTPKKLHFAKWSGTAWEIYTIDNDIGTQYYSGFYTRIKPITNDEIEIYATVDIGGTLEVVKYVSEDGGVTWSKQQITSNSAYHNVNLSPVENHDELVYWFYGGPPETIEIRTYPLDIPSAIPQTGRWNPSEDNGLGNTDISNGYLNLEAPDDKPNYGVYSQKWLSPINIALRFLSKVRLVYFTQIGFDNTGRTGGGGDDWLIFYFRDSPESDNIGRQINGSRSDITQPLTHDEWIVREMQFKNGKANIIEGESVLLSDIDSPTDDMRIVCMCAGGSGWSAGVDNANIDWILVRKYTEPEPSVSLGEEESA